MQNIKRIGINMVSGGAGYVLPMIINLVATPIVLKILGSEAYGLQVLANVIIGYLIVADMGLDIPVTRRVAEFKQSEQDIQKSEFLIATLKIYLLIGFFGLALIVAFTSKLTALLSIPRNMIEEGHQVFLLSGVGFVGSIINMWGKAVFNGQQRYEIANGISIATSVFGISIGLLLIINGFGIVGFFAARVAGLAISAFISIFLISKNFINFSIFPIIHRDVWILLKSQIGYGLLLRLSGMIFSRMDQTLISVWIGISAVAIYSFPILIAISISGLIASITHFAFPLVSSLANTKSTSTIESFFFKISKFIVIISSMAFLPFIFLGDKFLKFWISPEVANEGHYVLIYLTIAFYANTCLTVGLNSFIVGSGQLRYFTSYSITRGIVLLVGFFVLIKIYGIEGAGLSYMIAILVDIVFVVFSINKKLNFSLALLFKNVYLKPILIGIVLGCVIIPFKNWINTWSELIVSISIFELLYVGLAFLVGIIDQSEKKIITSILSKVKTNNSVE